MNECVFEVVAQCEHSATVRCVVCGRVVRVNPLHVGTVYATCRNQAVSDTMHNGAGTHLKKLLALIGITAKPNCSCNAKARTMDANGCDWCEEHLEEIVGWLREEATKRKLPFLDAAGRVLVRRAIRNARKEQARAKAAKEGTDKGGGSTV